MTALTFSSSPRILADGATVSTIAASSWGSRSDGLADGDVLRVTDTGMSYIWSESLARWVIPEMYALTCTQLATVVGDSATLGDEGWTHALSTGDTTTDGTSVTLSINGASEQEQWTVAPTAGRHVYVSGYITHSSVTSAQLLTGIMNGTRQLGITRNSAIGGGSATVVRSGAISALRTGEYASSITDTSPHWWDILYDPDATTGQSRVWVDHSPWFACGTSALESITANTVYIIAQVNGIGTHSGSMTLRDLAVIEGV